MSKVKFLSPYSIRHKCQAPLTGSAIKFGFATSTDNVGSAFHTPLPTLVIRTYAYIRAQKRLMFGPLNSLVVRPRINSTALEWVVFQIDHINNSPHRFNTRTHSFVNFIQDHFIVSCTGFKARLLLLNSSKAFQKFSCELFGRWLGGIHPKNPRSSQELQLVFAQVKTR